jgi:hypothetical protein
MLQDIDGHNLVYTRWAYNVDDKLLPYVNSVPWSLINVLHTPYFVNICVRPEGTVIVSLLTEGD